MIEFEVNGKPVSTDSEPETSLLWGIRVRDLPVRL